MGARFARALLGAPDSDADLLYAARYPCADPVAWFEWNGTATLLVNDLELAGARREARPRRVLPFSRFQPALRRRGVLRPVPADFLAQALRDRGARRVEVPAGFPAGAVAALEASGIRVRSVPDPFFPQRARKRPEEVRWIREALRSAEAGLREGIRLLRRSRIGRRGLLRLDGRVLTSETLRSRIDAAIFAAGGIPSRSIVAGGFQGADPHERGRGPLRANRPIVLDLFPRSRTTGYYGDITRTVVKGAPDPRTRAAFAAVTEAVRMARGGVAAGASCAEIHRRVAEHFERAGFPVSRRKGAPEGFFHGTGHGIGLDLHELPHVSLRGGRLEAGNVITLEPGLYYRSLGGIRIEEVVLVTRTGCRQLTRFPVFLEIP